MANPVEVWKAAKHGFDVWPDVLEHARRRTPMSQIDEADLERMKWHGFYYRKRDEPGRYMNRIRITGNELTADQAREVAHLACEYGHGIVDVTTRANLQIQGIEIENVPLTAARLSKVGLTSAQTGHDNIRNVFCHPFSGVDPDEVIDTRELCRAIDRVYLGSREYSDLPRKFNIAMNGVERHGAHFWTQDLSFLATRGPDGEPAFHVLVAGTQGQSTHLAWVLPVLVLPDQVADVSRAILDLFRAQGSREKRNAARFRYVVERIGIAGVLEWLDQQLPFPLLPAHQEPIPASSPDELVGWFRQKDIRKWTLGLCIPLGRLTWEQLEGLARLAKKWGNGQLRTTAEQGLAVINIPTGFKDAAATDAAALGLTLHADPIALNTVACTGQQFCNIAVTETKGHMFQLMDRLRQKGVVLHGIRIHMSGCPSSCAQHYTADIGLKGVRVRRVIGTREGFDVLLGGGLAGQVHLGLPYKLGVDVDQLPNLIEEVAHEYYLHHQAGQTFSAYWRDRLRTELAAKVNEGDFQPPVWVCEKCDYHHHGEDPPVFCPRCAGLRRYFARLAGDEPAHPAAAAAFVEPSAPATLADAPAGYQLAAAMDAIPPGRGLRVESAGRELALFREGDAVYAMDDACPHEGGPLSEGELSDGVVTCPWHAWRFNACTGCSLEPDGRPAAVYETRIERGQVYVKLTHEAADPSAPNSTISRLPQESAPNRRPTIELDRQVTEIIDEAPGVKTFRLDNSDGALVFERPGQFLKVCAAVDGRDLWRSFTISSSPARCGTLDLTIKRNPQGKLSKHLFEHLSVGGPLRIRGPSGGFFFDHERHLQPLVLVSAGSGITPMMSILRYLHDRDIARPCTFLHGARSAPDILFHDECRQLADRHHWLTYVVTLSQPPLDWSGRTGRLNCDLLGAQVADVSASRFFLCGPNDFMETLTAALIARGVPTERIHTEQFHTAASGVLANG